MHGIALLLGLLAAGCLYAAAPNQVLFAPPTRGRRRLLCSAAAALCAVAVVLWNDVLGWAGAVIAVALVMTGALSLWPLAGAWLQRRRAIAEAQP
ncbi:hypothetical protein [Ralstonia mannitolilytica]|uniref:DUF3325 domain-containing protein n=1 Tax=Ralstonia mannitolilytica TaxID=105219 RepID=A0AAD2AIR7_9RALS|nr:hypothetical protein [Ralstonia mannitolilytica]ATG22344.1 hypothetical protein CO705_20900 [Ralstonia pickettii]MBY4716996.1 hypothetical protein [Ralstonia mannitolilytica]CAJ0680532.1 hypothetical protein R77591_00888 [Ralstonia mannitolilytica]CAJ0685461.1 hypothetical protein LMG18102_00403 [Ralstonia mannitolilytica]CAJ0863027.1 hypothetical protein R1479_01018 [Ralstonia mannitolilytica]